MVKYYKTKKGYYYKIYNNGFRKRISATEFSNKGKVKIQIRVSPKIKILKYEKPKIKLVIKPKIDTCKTFHDIFRVIGKPFAAGTYGSIYNIETKNKLLYRSKTLIMKVLSTQDACMDAEKEFKKHLQIYKAFIELPNTHLLRKYAVISKPLHYCNESITIDSKTYPCFIIMEKLNGIPMDVLREYAPANDYVSSLPESMVHLAWNRNSDVVWLFTGKHHPDGHSRPTDNFYGIDYRKKVSETNPNRGYFSSEDNPLIDHLLYRYQSDLTKLTIREIIWQIYAFIYFKCNMAPLDIEILFGIHNGELKINILDFGMVTELKIYRDDEIPTDVRANAISLVSTFYKADIMNSVLLNSVLYDISQDLYLPTDGGLGKETFIKYKDIV